MVQKGNFFVQLIEAKSKEPFLEHKGVGDSNDTHYVDGFVEIEPGSEYFIRVANDSSDIVICNVVIDGSDLGYEFCLGPSEYDDKGLWKLENGKSQHTALKVHKVLSSANTVADANSDIGVITVDFFEYIEGEGTEVAQEFQSKWNGDNAIEGKENSENDDSKRKVKSQVGLHSETLSNDDGQRKVYSYGNDIETIRMKYCTAVGLIVEGVLPKPPLWEWARISHPEQDSSNSKKILHPIEPKILKLKTCDDDGNVVENKEIEMFDLTTEED